MIRSKFNARFFLQTTIPLQESILKKRRCEPVIFGGTFDDEDPPAGVVQKAGNYERLWEMAGVDYIPKTDPWDSRGTATAIFTYMNG